MSWILCLVRQHPLLHHQQGARIQKVRIYQLILMLTLHEDRYICVYVLVIEYSCYVCLTPQITSSNLVKFSIRPPNLIS